MRIAARCRRRGTARGHPRALPRAPSCPRPFPARVRLCKCWRCGSSTAPCIFEQALLFPVSCQIITFGVQGSSALRRTKLKLELVELHRRNTVFPGDARAACGQTPTAAEIRVPAWCWCDPGMLHRAAVLPRAHSVHGQQPQCASLWVGTARGPQVGWWQCDLCHPSPLCCGVMLQPGHSVEMGSLWFSALLSVISESRCCCWGCIRDFLWSSPGGDKDVWGLGGPHLDLVGSSGCQGWVLRHQVPSCAQALQPPQGGGMGNAGAAFCLPSQRAGSVCSPSPKPYMGPELVAVPGPGCEDKLCHQGYQLSCILLQRGSVLGPVLVPSLPGRQQEPHGPPPVPCGC